MVKSQITDNVVAFVKAVIEKLCLKEKGFAVSWSLGLCPVDVLDDAKLVDTRVASPLPLLGGEATFQAGLTLSVVEEGGRVLLSLTPHHPLVGKEQGFSVDLSRLEEARVGRPNASMHAHFLGQRLEDVVWSALIANREAEDLFRHRPKPVSMTITRPQPRSAFKPSREEVEARMNARSRDSQARRNRQAEPTPTRYFG